MLTTEVGNIWRIRHTRKDVGVAIVVAVALLMAEMRSAAFVTVTALANMVGMPSATVSGAVYGIKS